MPAPVVWLIVGVGVMFVLLAIFGRGDKGKR